MMSIFNTLVGSLGYTYTVKRRYDDENALWRCSVRNKTTSCLATIKQRGMEYTPGPHIHCHQPLLGADDWCFITGPSWLMIGPSWWAELVLHWAELVLSSGRVGWASWAELVIGPS